MLEYTHDPMVPKLRQSIANKIILSKELLLCQLLG
jgi:hypothetical protein